MPRWTLEEETVLKNLYDEGMVNPQISMELKRSVDSIQKKLQQRGWTHRGSGQYKRNSDNAKQEKKVIQLDEAEVQTQIAEFIRTKGITKCPDRFVTPTTTGLTRNQECRQIAAIQLKGSRGKWKSRTWVY